MHLKNVIYKFLILYLIDLKISNGFVWCQAIQERHENTLLKAEMEKLREEIKGMREICRKKVGCPNCGTADAGEDHVAFTTTEQLRIKNAKLKAEVTLNLIYLNLPHIFFF